MSGRWIAALACLLVAGCGSEERLGTETAGRLHDDVEEIRTAAGEGDRAAALSGLETLANRIERAARDGRLPEADAEALRRGVAAARTQAERELAEAAPEPAPEEPAATPEAPPPAAEPAPAAPAKPGKGKKPKKPKGPPPGGGDEDDDEGDG